MARSFNGTSDNINLGSSATLNPSGASAAMSISAWVFSTALNAAYNSVFCRDTTLVYELLVKGTGKCAVYWVDNAGNTSSIDPATITLSLNAWHHLVVTIPGDGVTNAKLYVDNVFDSNVGTGTGGIKASVENTIIGSTTAGASFFAGSIADVAIWNIALNTTDIANLFNGIRPASVQNAHLVGWWPLDGYASPETDLSGNGNTGTLTGTSRVIGPPQLWRTFGS